MTVHLPPALTAAVEEALESVRGPAHRVARAEPFCGGCVNPSVRLVTEGGESFFLKWNSRAPRGLFDAEADGLRALRAMQALRVPSVLAVGEQTHGPAWLLLEYIAPGRPTHGYAAELGDGLAALHRSADGGWGWARANFIGPLPQENPPASTWAELWRDARLAPQLRQARERGHFHGADARLLERVLDRTEGLLADAEADGPSLLHGDLWGGNVYADGAGRPVLIDPAVYRGHREVDLAMSELFGGFPSGWPAAYHVAWPLDPAYRGFRRSLYQLYYLLVHVNLFGAGYEAGCLEAASQALRGDSG